VVVAPGARARRLRPGGTGRQDLITSTVNDERLAQFKDKGVHLVVDGAPHLFGHVLGPNLFDAMILAATGKHPDEMFEDDYLDIVTKVQLEPRILYPNGFKRVNRFAFVIHPLSQEYFKIVKPVEVLSRVSPPLLMDSLEKVMAYAPPFVYSRVDRHPLAHRRRGRGLADLGGRHAARDHEPQPRVHLPPAARRRRDGRKLGAQIMGLGAFTKVVGDAGVTVAKRAPLPITTGNSYSASGALWAAHDALLRMRLLPQPNGKERCASRRWWWAPPAPSARPARGCWCVRPRRSTWCRPRPPSCWR
jgi:hypothetical protein